MYRGRRAGWDCVWLQYTSFPDLAVLALCRWFGYKVLVTPHLGANWVSQTNPILRYIGLRLLAMAHGIALLSESQAEEVALPPMPARFKILTFLPRSLSSVRRNDPEAAEPDTMTLIHAARLSKAKGTFSFIEVCARLKQSGRRVRGRLAGSCDDATAQEIRSLISTRNLVDEIEFLGSLSERDLLGELVRADILVHLSWIDSYPLIVLESIGCGVFPICLDLPGARAITGSYCGHVVGDPDTEKKVADFILAADLPGLRRSARVAGSRLRADYDWSQCVSVCERALTSVSAMP
ncbi:MAG: glycosyltransferase [Proteobacteria bacterium]|nr:glycosyltransferase [Pseudomonadota bacterium]